MSACKFCAGACEVLPSLLEFQPQHYGLPPFEDNIGETIPLDPIWRLKGTVVKGFGRGSKVCEFRTHPAWLPRR